MTDIAPRRPVEADLEPLADLFFDLWTLAHADHVPESLRILRTRADMLRRLRGFGDGLRVIGAIGAPQGFVAVAGEEIDQLYLAQPLWGAGAAQALVAEGLRLIAAAGYDRAILYCNPGNARAAAFYAKSGWSLRGPETVLLDSAHGPFPLECLVFERPTNQL